MRIFKKFTAVLSAAIYIQVNVAWAGFPSMPLPFLTYNLFNSAKKISPQDVFVFHYDSARIVYPHLDDLNRKQNESDLNPEIPEVPLDRGRPEMPTRESSAAPSQSQFNFNALESAISDKPNNERADIITSATPDIATQGNLGTKLDALVENIDKGGPASERKTLIQEINGITSSMGFSVSLIDHKISVHEQKNNQPKEIVKDVEKSNVLSSLKDVGYTRDLKGVDKRTVQIEAGTEIKKTGDQIDFKGQIQWTTKDGVHFTATGLENGQVQITAQNLSGKTVVIEEVGKGGEVVAKTTLNHGDVQTMVNGTLTHFEAKTGAITREVLVEQKQQKQPADGKPAQEQIKLEGSQGEYIVRQGGVDSTFKMVNNEVTLTEMKDNQTGQVLAATNNGVAEATPQGQQAGLQPRFEVTRVSFDQQSGQMQMGGHALLAKGQQVEGQVPEAGRGKAGTSGALGAGLTDKDVDVTVLGDGKFQKTATTDNAKAAIVIGADGKTQHVMGENRENVKFKNNAGQVIAQTLDNVDFKFTDKKGNEQSLPKGSFYSISTVDKSEQTELVRLGLTDPAIPIVPGAKDIKGEYIKQGKDASFNLVYTLGNGAQVHAIRENQVTTATLDTKAAGATEFKLGGTNIRVPANTDPIKINLTVGTFLPDSKGTHANLNNVVVQNPAGTVMLKYDKTENKVIVQVAHLANGGKHTFGGEVVKENGKRTFKANEVQLIKNAVFDGGKISFDLKTPVILTDQTADLNGATLNGSAVARHVDLKVTSMSFGFDGQKSVAAEIKLKQGDVLVVSDPDRKAGASTEPKTAGIATPGSTTNNFTIEHKGKGDDRQLVMVAGANATLALSVSETPIGDENSNKMILSATPNVFAKGSENLTAGAAGFEYAGNKFEQGLSIDIGQQAEVTVKTTDQSGKMTAQDGTTYDFDSNSNAKFSERGVEVISGRVLRTDAPQINNNIDGLTARVVTPRQMELTPGKAPIEKVKGEVIWKATKEVKIPLENGALLTVKAGTTIKSNSSSILDGAKILSGPGIRIEGPSEVPQINGLDIKVVPHIVEIGVGNIETVVQEGRFDFTVTNPAGFKSINQDGSGWSAKANTQFTARGVDPLGRPVDVRVQNDGEVIILGQSENQVLKNENGVKVTVERQSVTTITKDGATHISEQLAIQGQEGSEFEFPNGGPTVRFEKKDATVDLEEGKFSLDKKSSEGTRVVVENAPVENGQHQSSIIFEQTKPDTQRVTLQKLITADDGRVVKIQSMATAEKGKKEVESENKILVKQSGSDRFDDIGENKIKFDFQGIRHYANSKDGIQVSQKSLENKNGKDISVLGATGDLMSGSVRVNNDGSVDLSTSLTKEEKVNPGVYGSGVRLTVQDGDKMSVTHTRSTVVDDKLKEHGFSQNIRTEQITFDQTNRDPINFKLGGQSVRVDKNGKIQTFLSLDKLNPDKMVTAFNNDGVYNGVVRQFEGQAEIESGGDETVLMDFGSDTALVLETKGSNGEIFQRFTADTFHKDNGTTDRPNQFTVNVGTFFKKEGNHLIPMRGSLELNGGSDGVVAGKVKKINILHEQKGTSSGETPSSEEVHMVTTENKTHIITEGTVYIGVSEQAAKDKSDKEIQSLPGELTLKQGTVVWNDDYKSTPEKNDRWKVASYLEVGSNGEAELTPIAAFVDSDDSQVQANQVFGQTNKLYFKKDELDHKSEIRMIVFNDKTMQKVGQFTVDPTKNQIIEKTETIRSGGEFFTTGVGEFTVQGGSAYTRDAIIIQERDKSNPDSVKIATQDQFELDRGKQERSTIVIREKAAGDIVQIEEKHDLSIIWTSKREYSPQDKNPETMDEESEAIGEEFISSVLVGTISEGNATREVQLDFDALNKAILKKYFEKKGSVSAGQLKQTEKSREGLQVSMRHIFFRRDDSAINKDYIIPQMKGQLIAMMKERTEGVLMSDIGAAVGAYIASDGDSEVYNGVMKEAGTSESKNAGIISDAIDEVAKMDTRDIINLFDRNNEGSLGTFLSKYEIKKSAGKSIDAGVGFLLGAEGLMNAGESAGHFALAVGQQSLNFFTFGGGALLSGAGKGLVVGGRSFIGVSMTARAARLLPGLKTINTAHSAFKVGRYSVGLGLLADGAGKGVMAVGGKTLQLYFREQAAGSFNKFLNAPTYSGLGTALKDVAISEIGIVAPLLGAVTKTKAVNAIANVAGFGEKSKIVRQGAVVALTGAVATGAKHIIQEKFNDKSFGEAIVSMDFVHSLGAGAMAGAFAFGAYKLLNLVGSKLSPVGKEGAAKGSAEKLTGLAAVRQSAGQYAKSFGAEVAQMGRNTIVGVSGALAANTYSYLLNDESFNNDILQVVGQGAFMGFFGGGALKAVSGWGNAFGAMKTVGGVTAFNAERVKSGAAMGAWEVVFNSFENDGSVFSWNGLINPLTWMSAITKGAQKIGLAGDLPEASKEGSFFDRSKEKFVSTFLNISALHPFFSLGRVGKNPVNNIVEKGGQFFRGRGTALLEKGTGGAVFLGSLSRLGGEVLQRAVAMPLTIKTFEVFEHQATRAAIATGLVADFKRDALNKPVVDQNGQFVFDSDNQQRSAFSHTLVKTIGFLNAPIHAPQSGAVKYVQQKLAQGETRVRDHLPFIGKRFFAGQTKARQGEAAKWAALVDGVKGEYGVFRFFENGQSFEISGDALGQVRLAANGVLARNENVGRQGLNAENSLPVRFVVNKVGEIRHIKNPMGKAEAAELIHSGAKDKSPEAISEARAILGLETNEYLSKHEDSGEFFAVKPNGDVRAIKVDGISPQDARDVILNAQAGALDVDGADFKQARDLFGLKPGEMLIEADPALLRNAMVAYVAHASDNALDDLKIKSIDGIYRKEVASLVVLRTSGEQEMKDFDAARANGVKPEILKQFGVPGTSMVTIDSNGKRYLKPVGGLSVLNDSVLAKLPDALKDLGKNPDQVKILLSEGGGIQIGGVTAESLQKNATLFGAEGANRLNVVHSEGVLGSESLVLEFHVDGRGEVSRYEILESNSENGPRVILEVGKDNIVVENWNMPARYFEQGPISQAELSDPSASHFIRARLNGGEKTANVEFNSSGEIVDFLVKGDSVSLKQFSLEASKVGYGETTSTAQIPSDISTHVKAILSGESARPRHKEAIQQRINQARASENSGSALRVYAKAMVDAAGGDNKAARELVRELADDVNKSDRTSAEDKQFYKDLVSAVDTRSSESRKAYQEKRLELILQGKSAKEIKSDKELIKLGIDYIDGELSSYVSEIKNSAKANSKSFSSELKQELKDLEGAVKELKNDIRKGRGNIIETVDRIKAEAEVTELFVGVVRLDARAINAIREEIKNTPELATELNQLLTLAENHTKNPPANEKEKNNQFLQFAKIFDSIRSNYDLLDFSKPKAAENAKRIDKLLTGGNVDHDAVIKQIFGKELGELNLGQRMAFHMAVKDRYFQTYDNGQKLATPQKQKSNVNAKVFDARQGVLLLQFMLGRVGGLAAGGGKTPVFIAAFGDRAIREKSAIDKEGAVFELVVFAEGEASKYLGEYAPLFRAYGMESVDGRRLANGKAEVAESAYSVEAGQVKVVVSDLHSRGFLERQLRAEPESKLAQLVDRNVKSLGLDEVDALLLSRMSFISSEGNLVASSKEVSHVEKIVDAVLEEMGLQKDSSSFNDRKSFGDGYKDYDLNPNADVKDTGKWYQNRGGEILISDGLFEAIESRINSKEITRYEIKMVIRALDAVGNSADFGFEKGEFGTEAHQRPTHKDKGDYKHGQIDSSVTFNIAATIIGRFAKAQDISKSEGISWNKALKQADKDYDLNDVRLSDAGSSATFVQVLQRNSNNHRFGATGTPKALFELAPLVIGMKVVDVDPSNFSDYSRKVVNSIKEAYAGQRAKNNKEISYIDISDGIKGDNRESAIQSRKQRMTAQAINRSLTDGQEAGILIGSRGDADLIQGLYGYLLSHGGEKIVDQLESLQLKDIRANIDKAKELINSSGNEQLKKTAERIRVIDGKGDSDAIVKTAAKEKLVVFATEVGLRALSYDAKDGAQIDLLLMGTETFSAESYLQAFARVDRGESKGARRTILVDRQILENRVNSAKSVHEALQARFGRSGGLQIEISSSKNGRTLLDNKLDLKNTDLADLVEFSGEFGSLQDRAQSALFFINEQISSKLVKEPLAKMIAAEKSNGNKAGAKFLDGLRIELLKNSDKQDVEQGVEYMDPRQVASNAFSNGSKQALVYLGKIMNNKSVSPEIRVQAAKRYADISKAQQGFRDRVFETTTEGRHEGDRYENAAFVNVSERSSGNAAEAVSDVVIVLSELLLPDTQTSRNKAGVPGAPERSSVQMRAAQQNQTPAEQQAADMRFVDGVRPGANSQGRLLSYREQALVSVVNTVDGMSEEELKRFEINLKGFGILDSKIQYDKKSMAVALVQAWNSLGGRNDQFNIDTLAGVVSNLAAFNSEGKISKEDIMYVALASDGPILGVQKSKTPISNRQEAFAEVVGDSNPIFKAVLDSGENLRSARSEAVNRPTGGSVFQRVGRSLGTVRTVLGSLFSKPDKSFSKILKTKLSEFVTNGTYNKDQIVATISIIGGISNEKRNDLVKAVDMLVELGKDNKLLSKIPIGEVIKMVNSSGSISASQFAGLGLSPKMLAGLGGGGIETAVGNLIKEKEKNLLLTPIDPESNIGKIIGFGSLAATVGGTAALLFADFALPVPMGLLGMGLALRIASPNFSLGEMVKAMQPGKKQESAGWKQKLEKAQPYIFPIATVFSYGVNSLWGFGVYALGKGIGNGVLAKTPLIGGKLAEGWDGLINFFNNPTLLQKAVEYSSDSETLGDLFSKIDSDKSLSAEDKKGLKRLALIMSGVSPDRADEILSMDQESKEYKALMEVSLDDLKDEDKDMDTLIAIGFIELGRGNGVDVTPTYVSDVMSSNEGGERFKNSANVERKVYEYYAGRELSDREILVIKEHAEKIEKATPAEENKESGVNFVQDATKALVNVEFSASRAEIFVHKNESLAPAARAIGKAQDIIVKEVVAVLRDSGVPPTEINELVRTVYTAYQYVPYVESVLGEITRDVSPANVGSVRTQVRNLLQHGYYDQAVVKLHAFDGNQEAVGTRELTELSDKVANNPFGTSETKNWTGEIPVYQAARTLNFENGTTVARNYFNGIYSLIVNDKEGTRQALVVSQPKQNNIVIYFGENFSSDNYANVTFDLELGRQYTDKQFSGARVSKSANLTVQEYNPDTGQWSPVEAADGQLPSSSKVRFVDSNQVQMGPTFTSLDNFDLPAQPEKPKPAPVAPESQNAVGNTDAPAPSEVVENKTRETEESVTQEITLPADPMSLVESWEPSRQDRFQQFIVDNSESLENGEMVFAVHYQNREGRPQPVEIWARVNDDGQSAQPVNNGRLWSKFHFKLNDNNIRREIGPGQFSNVQYYAWNGEQFKQISAKANSTQTQTNPSASNKRDGMTNIAPALAVLSGMVFAAASYFGPDAVNSLTSLSTTLTPPFALATVGLMGLGLMATRYFGAPAKKESTPIFDLRQAQRGDPSLILVPTQNGPVGVRFAEGVSPQDLMPANKSSNEQVVLWKARVDQNGIYNVVGKKDVSALEIKGNHKQPTPLMRELISEISSIKVKNPVLGSRQAAVVEAMTELVRNPLFGPQMNNILVSSLLSSFSQETLQGYTGLDTARIQAGNLILGDVLNSSSREFKDYVLTLIAFNGNALSTPQGIFLSGNVLTDGTDNDEVLLPVHTQPQGRLLPSLQDRLSARQLKQFLKNRDIAYPGFLVVTDSDGKIFTFYDSITDKILTIDAKGQVVEQAEEQIIPYQNPEVLLGNGLQTNNVDPVFSEKLQKAFLNEDLRNAVQAILEMNLTPAQERTAFLLAGRYAINNNIRPEDYLLNSIPGKISLGKLIESLGQELFRNPVTRGLINQGGIGALPHAVHHFMKISAAPAMEQEWIFRELNFIKLINPVEAAQRAKVLAHKIQNTSAQDYSSLFETLAGFNNNISVRIQAARSNNFSSASLSRYRKDLVERSYYTPTNIAQVYAGRNTDRGAQEVGLTLLIPALLESLMRVTSHQMDRTKAENVLRKLQVKTIDQSVLNRDFGTSGGVLLGENNVILVGVQEGKTFAQLVATLTHELAHILRDDYVSMKKGDAALHGANPAAEEAVAQLAASQALRHMGLDLIADVADLKTLDQIVRQADRKVVYVRYADVKGQDLSAVSVMLQQSEGIYDFVVLASPSELDAARTEFSASYIRVVDERALRAVNPSERETKIEAYSRINFGTRKARILGQNQNDFKDLISAGGELFEILYKDLPVNLGGQIKRIYDQIEADRLAGTQA